MQSAFEHASPTWIQIGVGLLLSAITGGGVVKLLGLWFSRGERAARARKIDAETRQLDVQVQQMRGDIVLEFVDRLSNQQLQIDQMRRERDEWKAVAEEAQAKNRVMEAQEISKRKRH